jgi:hypothetical protein
MLIAANHRKRLQSMDPLDLKPGSKVFHALFGVGTVRALSGAGSTAKATISFGPSVGDKTLLVASAPLRPADESLNPVQHWCESLTVRCALRRGRQQPNLDAVRERIRVSVSAAAFWTAVREALRAAQNTVPKVLDDPSGSVSISVRAPFDLEIRIKHTELLKPEQRVLARAVFRILAQQCLGEIETLNFRADFTPGGALVQADLVEVSDDALPLTDRAPRRKPLPVRAKGLITNMPRRRDDY